MNNSQLTQQNDILTNNTYCTSNLSQKINTFVQRKVQEFSYVSVENTEGKTIQEMQTILRNSLEKTQEFSFETRDREDIPYVFRGETLFHKQAIGLTKEYPDNLKTALAIIYRDYTKDYMKNLKNLLS